MRNYTSKFFKKLEKNARKKTKRKKVILGSLLQNSLFSFLRIKILLLRNKKENGKIEKIQIEKGEMMNWTKEQEQAILEKNCNLLVAAAAGSRKNSSFSTKNDPQNCRRANRY